MSGHLNTNPKSLGRQYVLGLGYVFQHARVSELLRIRDKSTNIGKESIASVQRWLALTMTSDQHNYCNEAEITVLDMFSDEMTRLILLDICHALDEHRLGAKAGGSNPYQGFVKQSMLNPVRGQGSWAQTEMIVFKGAGRRGPGYNEKGQLKWADGSVLETVQPLPMLTREEVAHLYTIADADKVTVWEAYVKENGHISKENNMHPADDDIHEDDEFILTESGKRNDGLDEDIEYNRGPMRGEPPIHGMAPRGEAKIVEDKRREDACSIPIETWQDAALKEAYCQELREDNWGDDDDDDREDDEDDLYMVAEDGEEYVRRPLDSAYRSSPVDTAPVNTGWGDEGNSPLDSDWGTFTNNNQVKSEPVHTPVVKQTPVPKPVVKQAPVHTPTPKPIVKQEAPTMINSNIGRRGKVTRTHGIGYNQYLDHYTYPTFEDTGPTPYQYPSMDTPQVAGAPTYHEDELPFDPKDPDAYIGRSGKDGDRKYEVSFSNESLVTEEFTQYIEQETILTNFTQNPEMAHPFFWVLTATGERYKVVKPVLMVGCEVSYEMAPFVIQNNRGINRNGLGTTRVMPVFVPDAVPYGHRIRWESEVSQPLPVVAPVVAVDTPNLDELVSSISSMLDTRLSGLATKDDLDDMRLDIQEVTVKVDNMLAKEATICEDLKAVTTKVDSLLDDDGISKVRKDIETMATELLTATLSNKAVSSKVLDRVLVLVEKKTAPKGSYSEEVMVIGKPAPETVSEEPVPDKLDTSTDPGDTLDTSTVPDKWEELDELSKDSDYVADNPDVHDGPVPVGPYDDIITECKLANIDPVTAYPVGTKVLPVVPDVYDGYSYKGKDQDYRLKLLTLAGKVEALCEHKDTRWRPDHSQPTPHSTVVQYIEACTNVANNGRTWSPSEPPPINMDTTHVQLGIA